MLRMLKNTLIMSIVMLAVLAIVSYAHASILDDCSDCHKQLNANATKILTYNDAATYRGSKFTLKRVVGDETLSVYIVTIGSKNYILNSKGGIVEYR